MVSINYDLCVGCGECLIYCPLGVIRLENDIAVISQEECTNCYVCIRQKVCSLEAIEPAELDTFIKNFQHVISDPVETTSQTGVPGRGTEEAKTNDVTGRIKKGEIGICIDMGRPGVGCYLRDVEKVAMAIVQAGAILEDAEHTPLSMLMDSRVGKINEQYLDIRLLSVIIEGKCKEENLSEILTALKDIEGQIETVFCLGLVSRVNENGESSVLRVITELGLSKPTRGKVNVGLGHPLKD